MRQRLLRAEPGDACVARRAPRARWAFAFGLWLATSFAWAGSPPGSTKPPSYGEVEVARPPDEPPPRVVAQAPLPPVCEPHPPLPWFVAGGASIAFILAFAWALRERNRANVVSEELSRIRIHRTSMLRATGPRAGKNASSPDGAPPATAPKDEG